MAESFRLVQSASAAIRLDAAASFLEQLPPTQPVTIVAASRGAADDFARRVAIARGATFGIGRFSLTQLAARVAINQLAGRGIAPASGLGAEAVAARAVFDAASAGGLRYLAGVAETPGFPRALARTVADLRLAGIQSGAVAHAGQPGPDLAALLQRIERELDEASIADRTRLLAAATFAVADDAALAIPLILLDVAVNSPAEAAFVQALTRTASVVLATCPAHDVDACDALGSVGGIVDQLEERLSGVGHRT